MLLIRFEKKVSFMLYTKTLNKKGSIKNTK